MLNNNNLINKKHQKKGVKSLTCSVIKYKIQLINPVKTILKTGRFLLSILALLKQGGI